MHYHTFIFKVVVTMQQVISQNAQKVMSTE